jgi:Leucine-rich repeat (LRR) protein
MKRNGLWFTFVFAYLALESHFAWSAPSMTPSSVESLVTKGVKVKRNAAKQVTEMWVQDQTTLTEADFRAIKKMRSLKTLFLRQPSRQLDDDMLSLLGPMPSVEYLYTNMATISDEGMQLLSKWKGLRRLTMIHWGWSEGWKALPSAEQMPGKGLACLAALPNLTQLDIGGSRIDDSALTAVGAIKSLEELRLFHAIAITDAGVPALSVLPNLRSLQFGSPQVTDLALKHLSRFPNLTDIEVDETILSYAGGFRHLKALVKLKTITLKDVVSESADIAALQADHPDAKIVWTSPNETVRSKIIVAKAKQEN